MFIHELLSKDLPFAVYRFPEEQAPVYVLQTCPAREFSLGRLEEQKGFVVAPFDAYKTRKACLIEPDFIACNKAETEKFSAVLSSLPDKNFRYAKTGNVVVDKDTYLQQAQRLIWRMKEGEVQKVVLSRVLEKPLPQAFDFDVFYEIFQQSYPHAFVYLFYLPGKGLWAGATPETLLSRNGEFYETMALAGTQKRPGNGVIPRWNEKEKCEQAFVTRFVEEQINSLHLKKTIKYPEETIFAGSLAHICTRFRIPVPILRNRTGHLVSLLHPTPAVCGLPKEKAWQMIAETEQHTRRFYTGFLGPWQMENHSHLFVNLRCAEFFNEKLALYVGGGLTAGSVPEKEWQETEDKSATLLSVVEKLRNFAL